MNMTDKSLFMQNDRLSLYAGNTLHMQTTSSQPRAIYYVVALQIWEYFGFYGMRALLILYLTNQLKYDDNHAYALFSAYCSLVYVTPILGGYLPISC